MVQMPTGIPVATVAVGGAKNAAILAARILAIKYPEVNEKLKEYRKTLTKGGHR
jgi:5-(carboxyamino)imidazole ribonucleotide mutase